MAMNIINWNVQQGGDDNNGGGYIKGGNTTNYSLQDVAELTIADGVTAGIGNTTLTSVTGGFTPAMSGNTVHIYGGTNVLPSGWYEIQSYTDTNTIGLDRAPDDGVGGINSATCKVGGALATVGGLGAPLAYTSATRIVGSRGWIKYSATPYEVTNNTPNVSNGRFIQQSDWNLPFSIIGYYETQGDDCYGNNRPTINGNSGGSLTAIVEMIESTDEYKSIFANLIINELAGTTVDAGIRTNGGNGYVFNCKVTNTNYGFSACSVFGCEASGCKTAFHATSHAIKCISHHNPGNGFSTGGNYYNCLAYRNTGNGFIQINAESNYYNCASINNNADGFGKVSAVGARYINCIATHNGAYGFDLETNALALFNCYTFGNTTGSVNLDNVDHLGGPLGLANVTDLTVDPWVSSPSSVPVGEEYWLNNTAGGGAVLRGAGLKMPFPLGGIDAPDIGPVQHVDAPVTYFAVNF